jgi:hypothetical protein
MAGTPARVIVKALEVAVVKAAHPVPPEPVAVRVYVVPPSVLNTRKPLPAKFETPSKAARLKVPAKESEPFGLLRLIVMVQLELTLFPAAS